jgi:hypothetical protein
MLATILKETFIDRRWPARTAAAFAIGSLAAHIRELLYNHEQFAFCVLVTAGAAPLLIAFLNHPFHSYLRAFWLATAGTVAFTAYSVIAWNRAAVSDARVAFEGFGYLMAGMSIWLYFCFVSLSAVALRRRVRPIFPAGHCHACGYSLRGLEATRCPECGCPADAGDIVAANMAKE